MSRQLKLSAFLSFVLAVIFYLFFQICKHDPALVQVGAFLEDPYDAVGSVGIQFAAFTAALSLVRAFRPYQAGKLLEGQQIFLVRGAYLTCWSVAVTVLADVVAMTRHPAIWMGSLAGAMLIVCIGGIALLTVLVCCYIHYATRIMRFSTIRSVWTRAAGITVVSIIALALYPEEWRQSIPGALFTAFFGLVFFWIVVWAVGIVSFPYPVTVFEDFIDDLVSVYHWMKAHAGPFAILGTHIEKILARPFIHTQLRWLNPRKHSWNLVILFAVVTGIALALIEMLSEGIDPNQLGRLTMVIAVFVGLEGAGVLLGYILLAKSMGIFRLGGNYQK